MSGSVHIRNQHDAGPLAVGVRVLRIPLSGLFSIISAQRDRARRQVNGRPAPYPCCPFPSVGSDLPAFSPRLSMAVSRTPKGKPL